MKKIPTLTLFFLLLTKAPAQPSQECVVLLHGLARTKDSFTKFEKVLSEKGYTVFNIDYESRKYPIQKLVQQIFKPNLIEDSKCTYLHFVTHSMGGIIVRYYLSQHNLPNLGKVVMLGPPNQGSEVVDYLKNVSLFQWINGPAGSELGTDSLSVPKLLDSAHFQLGIIAGSLSINWINSLLIPGKDDGKVSVESTKLNGMKDHITLATTHPMMMKNKEVIRQTLYFLRNGKFDSYTNGK